MRTVSFSTMDIPESFRAEFWIEEFGRTIARTEITLGDRSDCAVSGVIAETNNHSIFQASIASPMSFIRTESLLNDSDDGFTLLIAEQGGFSSVDRYNNQFIVAKGMAVFIPHSELGGTSNFGGSSALSISLTRDQLGWLDPLCLDLLTSAKPFQHELLGYLYNIAKSVVESEDQRGRLSVFADKHISEIVTSILRSFLPKYSRMKKRVTADDILNEIAVDYDNPFLSAYCIAEKLKCSIRHIHQCLEPTGKCFSKHVIVARINEAVRRIESNQTKSFRMIDLAIDIGFSDISYFNRMFKSQMGMSPSSYLKQYK